LQAPRAKSGLWSTKVEFGTTEMQFVPAQSHFHQSVQALLEGMITSIHAVPRLLYMRPFKPYFHSGRVEGPDVAKLVREAAKFRQVQAELDQIVVEDFDRCRKYAQQFEEHRVIHVFGAHWNFEAYAEVQFNASFKDTVVNFTSDMRQLAMWYKNLDKGMKVSGSDRKSTRLNSSHPSRSRMPSSA